VNYWIDGYNFFFRLTKDYQTMKQQEKDLLEGLYQAMMQLHSPMTVVFDGREKDPPEPLRRNLLSMNIVYTPSTQTADQYILEMLDSSFNPLDEMVISSDKELLTLAKQKGARTQTIEAFIQKLSTPKKGSIKEKKQQKETSTQFARLLEIFQRKLENQ
jgi:predicted RNA-binding protein with PIN domain